jgi:N utilization substance protein B
MGSSTRGGGTRRAGRVAAVQLLYELDTRGWLGPDVDPAALAEAVTAHFTHLSPNTQPDAQHLAATLVQGVVEQRDQLDRMLEQASTHWRVERMSRVDRNILRLAAYELAWCPDVPPAVVLDEAIELAKQFGEQESSAFVNGVLNQVLQQLGRGR